MKIFRSLKNVFGGETIYDEKGKTVATSVPNIFGGETLIGDDGKTIGHSVQGILGKTYYMNDAEEEDPGEMPPAKSYQLVDGVDYNIHKPSLSVTAEMDEIMKD